MASEPTDGRLETLDLPDEVDEWLDERAAALDVDREEFVVRLLGAHQAVVAENGAASALEEPVEDAVDRQLGTLRSELGEELDDIRRRVVQVKQTADERAPADHSHEEFDRLEDVDERLSALENRVGELVEAVEGLQAAGDGEPTEEVELVDDGASTERLDDIEEKLTRVASAVVSLRQERTANAGEDGQERLADVQRQASREGIETAECGACGETASIALLPEAACPHCGAPFAGLQPSSGYFDEARLTRVRRGDNGE